VQPGVCRPLNADPLAGLAETHDDSPPHLNPAVRKIGWAYVCYHLALFLVGVYDAVSSYWSLGDFLGELAVGVTYYPVVVPAVMLCGLHQGCDSAAVRIARLLVLGLVVCWAIVGWRVALSTGWRWARRPRFVGQ
jgi:hypothetical protein